MGVRQFKTESKKLMDMMINSIYTHKEIFLRELISNASDAEDKLYFRSLTDDSVGMSRGDFFIRITADKDARTLTVSDNGIGMTSEELEKNLGTIAKSGTQEFSRLNGEEGAKNDVDVIGQFGVGFYSAFMVADLVTVESRAFGSDEAFRWSSKGPEGYTVEPCEKETAGTSVILHLKPDTDDEDYSRFLESGLISTLVKKYSDYIRYPIKMIREKTQMKPRPEDAPDDYKTEYETVEEDAVLNSMVPLWKKNKNDVTEEEYNDFYRSVSGSYDEPLVTIPFKTEGSATFSALLFIPTRAPFDFYSKSYEKGLKLYSKGVLITDKCADLLPDCFSFVKGLVDSEDLSLNISREMLQHDNQLKLIARTIEKKIKSELEKLLRNDREKYETFWKAFGANIKYGVYNDYGQKKELLKDLLMFTSSAEGKLTTLSEYVTRMKEDQKSIYYASGESEAKIALLPQTESVKEKGFEILYLTDYIDEFALKMLYEYEDKTFCNICAEDTGLETEEEKNALKQENENQKDLLGLMKEALGDAVEDVRFTGKLKNHPVCLTTEGEISAEMAQVLNSMPNGGGIKPRIVLEINLDHPVASKLKQLYIADDKDTVRDYAKVLLCEARLIEGLPIDDPSEFADLVTKLMV